MTSSNNKRKIFLLTPTCIFLLFISIRSYLVSKSALNDLYSARAIKNAEFGDTRARPPVFPQWDDPAAGSISLSSIVEFAHGVLAGNATTVERPKTRSRWPEILYVVDRKGVWVSEALRDRTWNMGLSRVKPTEAMLHYAWTMLQETNQPVGSTRWPALREAVVSQDGLPFFVWYGDYTSCNQHNWLDRPDYSIPLFTASAPINCTHAFPFPNYGTIDLLQNDELHWEQILQDQCSTYSWESKKRQVVWRGSLSAPNENLQSVRWRLCRLVTELSSETDKDLFDVGLVEIPSRHDHLNLNVSHVGGLKKPIRPMAAFQQYVAIVDVDGNAWSSRFGSLLCSSSVVIKVEPEHVEYFYQDLQPWTHYVPVRLDLTDLVDRARFVLEKSNEATVRGIVKNANDWCRTHLTYDETAGSMLDILEVYSSFLATRRAHSDWNKDWKQAKLKIFAKEFHMALVEPRM